MASIEANTEHQRTRALLGGMLEDLTALRATVAALVVDLTEVRGALVAVTAKLDADATVTGTDYAATCDPAALTAEAPADLATTE